MADIVTRPEDADYSVRTMVADVLNAAWNEGLLTKVEYSSKIAAAQADFLNETNAPTITAGTVTVPTVTAPGVTIPASAEVADVLDVFDSKYLELVALLSDKFTAFRGTYFPNESAAYTQAEAWLSQAIENPEVGLPAAVADQIYGDDQARIISEASRASDAVLATYAGRRFPLPPDVAAANIASIQQKAQDQLAESSRKIAILSVDQMKFCIEKALSLRQMAMGAAIDYIKALASGPDMASRMVGVGYDAQSKLISSAADFYRADTQAKEMVSKVAQYNNSLALDAAAKNQASELTLIEDKLKALLAEAQAIAQMSTSLLNNVHATVGIGANRNASVGYSYSNETTGFGPTTSDVG